MDWPAPLAGYFAAANDSDPDRVATRFAADATVEDEKRMHAGHAEIRRWAAEARARYDVRTEPFRLAAEAGGLVVHAGVSGDFPGSPVDLVYRFEIESGLIERLTIR